MDIPNSPMLPSLSEETNRILGAPFQWRGRGPVAYDCLGLVMHLYRSCYGVELPDPIGEGCRRRLEEFRSRFLELGSLGDVEEGDLLHIAGSDAISDQHVAVAETSRRAVLTNAKAGVQRAEISDLRGYPSRVRPYRLKSRCR